MQINLNKYYSLKSKVFPLDYLKSLENLILSCPYLDENYTNDNFAGTKEFALTFKRSGIGEVERNFPSLEPYLRIALNSECNAFNLNALVIKGGSCVKPHVDSIINKDSKAITIATIVSVLYVKVPPDLQGGELVFYKHGHQVGKIQPEANTLLYFRGDLIHSVNEVKSSQVRISMVCDQYKLSESHLQGIPDFEIISGLSVS
jgi:Rps23 Pro-64 3,4-dihydroxylase Tpa1-like proline 4-hydroxylase